MKLPSPPLHTATILLAVMAAGPAKCTEIGDILWEDTFDGYQGAVNSDYWNYDVGHGPNSDGWGNQELQIYTSDRDNVGVNGGNLEIIAIRDGTASNGFTSGRINTKGKVLFQYGTLEARIQIPSVVEGLWAAFWTLGGDFDTVSWPASGEIDIAELGAGSAIRDGVGNSRITSGAHWAAVEQGDQSGSLLRANALHSDYPYGNVAGNSSNYFTFKMDWTPTKIVTWVVHDDPMVGDFKLWEFGIDAESCLDCGDEFHKEHFVVLNLAVGGLYTSIPKSDHGNSSSSDSSSSSTTYTSDSSSSFFAPRTEVSAAMPATMKVDFVRIRHNGFTKVTIPADETPVPLPTPSPVTTTTIVDDLPPPLPPCQSIAEIVCANKNTTALCSYVSQAAKGVGDLLADKEDSNEPNNSERTYLTVFAPNDEAFKALGPPNAVASLFPDQESITNVLMTHVVEHPIPKSDLPCAANGGRVQTQTQMANNEFTETMCFGDRVFQIGYANIDSTAYPGIVDFDIRACNGIIHVLDGIILATGTSTTVNNTNSNTNSNSTTEDVYVYSKVPRSSLPTPMPSNTGTGAPSSSSPPSLTPPRRPSSRPSARGNTGRDAPLPVTGPPFSGKSGSGKSGNKSSKSSSKAKTSKKSGDGANLSLLQAEYSYFASSSSTLTSSTILVSGMLVAAVHAAVVCA
mmetsp:Transcript_13502/g.27743  ORF Transcript_13502/g.27743 Transcript_13502/m.27743 type:complete len:684 (+) Transcript_13502:628-2679(+)